MPDKIKMLVQAINLVITNAIAKMRLKAKKMKFSAKIIFVSSIKEKSPKSKLGIPAFPLYPAAYL